MNPIDLITKGIGTIGKTINNGIEIFKGNKKERDQYDHQENIETQKTYSSEFHNRNNRTLFDSFIDGVNRIPRPAFVLLIIFYFILSYKNPEEFQVLNLGLQTVPENMWVVLGVIITFYFGARELNKLHNKNGMAIDPEQFNKIQLQIQELRQFKKDNEDLKEFREETDRLVEEINNSSIEEWKKNK